MFNSKGKDTLDKSISTITRREIIPYLIIIGYIGFFTFISGVGISVVTALIYLSCFIITNQHIYLAFAIALFSLLGCLMLPAYCVISSGEIQKFLSDS